MSRTTECRAGRGMPALLASVLVVVMAGGWSGTVWAQQQEPLHNQDPGPTPEHPAQRMDRQPPQQLAEAEDPEQRLQRRPLQEGDPDAAWLPPPEAADDPGLRPEPHPLEPPIEDELAIPPEQARQMQRLAGHIGDPLVNPAGEEIGRIEEVVRDPQDQSLQVVVSTGGLLGIGGREVVVAADQLEPAEGELRTHRPMTRAQLEELAEYRPERYQQLAEGAAGDRAGPGWGVDEREG